MSRIAELQHSIKVHSQDLQDELSALVRWEDEMQRKNRTAASAPERKPCDVPIRGTQPLKTVEPVSSSTSSSPTAADVAKEQGNEYFRKGAYSDAIRLYSKGIDFNSVGPTAHVLYANRAMCHLKLSNWHDAEKDATKALDLDRTYTKAYFRRAQARKNLGLLREARKDLEAVLAFNSSDAETIAELKAVTLMLREKENSCAKPKKKLVIEEVDDDDADDGSDSETKSEAVNAKSAPEPSQAPKSTPPPARTVSSEPKAEQPPPRPLRLNSNVEELEDEPATTKPAIAPPTASEATKAQTAVSSSSAPTKLERLKKTAKHLDLSPPKSFSEFERVHAEIEGELSLLDQYFSQIPPSSLPGLFGVSLTSEVFCDWMEYCVRQSSDVAFQTLKGLSAVKRIGELTMFLSDEETQLMKRAIQHASASGNDVSHIQAMFE